MRSRFTVYGSWFRNRETKPQKNCVCVKITISVSRLNMLWKLKLVLNHSAITKFVILNAEIEYFFIGYLFIVMRAAIFSYLSAILKQFNYLRNLFCNIYDQLLQSGFIIGNRWKMNQVINFLKISVRNASEGKLTHPFDTERNNQKM